VNLAAGDLTAELAPRIGGSLASFRMRRATGNTDLLRPLSATARLRREAAGAAMFPMLPYANRIAGNRFEFDGHAYEFVPNAKGQRFNLHGTGWTSAWDVAASNADSAELTLAHLMSGEPYAYSARQGFTLTSNHLRVEMGITNLGPRAMPFGLGLHPWWQREPDAILKFRAAYFWLEGPDYLATDRISIPPELDFAQGRPLPTAWRNNCYSDWEGVAEILFPKLGIGLRIEADPIYAHLLLYCDPGRTDFCLEPQTHAVGALNRIDRNEKDGLGLRILRSQESFVGAVTFTPFQLGSTG
jgi:aldose 1-epimerase